LSAQLGFKKEVRNCTISIHSIYFESGNMAHKHSKQQRVCNETRPMYYSSVCQDSSKSIHGFSFREVNKCSLHIVVEL